MRVFCTAELASGERLQSKKWLFIIWYVVQKALAHDEEKRYQVQEPEKFSRDSSVKGRPFFYY